MKVGIIQSNYIPWRGYFDFIDSVELFVFYDDLQYTRRNWRNRNRIVTADGLRWLTVPVKNLQRTELIDEVAIDYSQNWAERHFYQLETNYRRAPFFRDYVYQFADIINNRFSSISALNVALCKWIMQILDIRTPTVMSRDLRAIGTRSERLLDVLARVGGTRYLSGPSADAYLDLDLFQRKGIPVEYKNYEYPPYPHFRNSARAEPTILDLLFNTGPDARKYLKSCVPDRVVA